MHGPNCYVVLVQLKNVKLTTGGCIDTMPLESVKKSHYPIYKLVECFKKKFSNVSPSLGYRGKPTLRGKNLQKIGQPGQVTCFSLNLTVTK